MEKLRSDTFGVCLRLNSSESFGDVFYGCETRCLKLGEESCLRTEC